MNLIEKYKALILPLAFGQFGYERHNPIPVSALGGCSNYLTNLYSSTGEKLEYEEDTTVQATNLPKLIYRYHISKDGIKLTSLYFYPYFEYDALLAPEGFKLSEKFMNQYFGNAKVIFRGLIETREFPKRFTSVIEKGYEFTYKYLENIPLQELCMKFSETYIPFIPSNHGGEEQALFQNKEYRIVIKANLINHILQNPNARVNVHKNKNTSNGFEVYRIAETDGTNYTNLKETIHQPLSFQWATELTIDDLASKFNLQSFDFKTLPKGDTYICALNHLNSSIRISFNLLHRINSISHVPISVKRSIILNSEMIITIYNIEECSGKENNVTSKQFHYNGLPENQEILDSVNLKKIHHLGVYHPYRGGTNPQFDAYSSNILSLKDDNPAAMIYFFKKYIEWNKEQFDIVTLVPSHNPAKTESSLKDLAQLIATKFKWEDGTDCLVRTQLIDKLSKGGNRNINIHLNSMAVNNLIKLKNMRVLLIDDVTTSGNSLKAAQQILLNAGAKSVYMFALAETKGN